VMRRPKESIYGPPEAVRWERGNPVDWGVIGFQVEAVPKEVPFQGAFRYKMQAIHKPERRNYPHSEVQVFESPWEQPDMEVHIGERELPGIAPGARLEWRELLRRECKVVLRPGQAG
jgi:hypothetical protein